MTTETMRLHGQIAIEVAKWSDIAWPIISLGAAKKLAEDIFRQYEWYKGTNQCVLLMAVIDADENYENHYSFTATGYKRSVK